MNLLTKWQKIEFERKKIQRGISCNVYIATRYKSLQYRFMFINFQLSHTFPTKNINIMTNYLNSSPPSFKLVDISITASRVWGIPKAFATIWVFSLVLIFLLALSDSYFDGSGTPVASVTTWPTCLARWCSWTTWAPCSTRPPSRSSWRSPSWWSTLKAAGSWRRGSASSPASSSRSSSSSSSSSSPPSFSPGDVRRWEETKMESNL